MQWHEYIERTISTRTVIDGISMDLNGEGFVISPIVKASVIMLESMIASQGNHNVFVFPEVSNTSKEFLIGKVLYNIAVAEKIRMEYDPDKFVKGQHLKYKGCTVAFNRIENDKKEQKTWIYISFAGGMVYGVPIEMAPFFQITESQKLSTYERFKKVYSIHDAIEAANDPTKDKDIVEKLENHKTFLDGSIFYVSSIKSTKEFMSNLRLENRKLSDVLYLAHANGDGIITNIGTGQLSGNPAIVIASDLFSVVNAIKSGANVQSVIFDASQSNTIEKQLDPLDELNDLDIPIVCITDTANSFEMDLLTCRRYNLWRWDSDSITDKLFRDINGMASKKTRNCATHSIDYRSIPGEEISQALKLLYMHKSEIEDQAPAVSSVYEKLLSLTFIGLRESIPLDSADITHLNQILSDCSSVLGTEKKYMPADLHSDMMSVIVMLRRVFTSGHSNLKYEAICDILLGLENEKVCIVIPDRMDRNQHEEYWRSIELPADISVKYPMEYGEDQSTSYDLVIIVGWLNNKTMRKIIYGFSSNRFIVLTYPCEEKWKRAHTSGWKHALSNSGNAEIVRKSLSTEDKEISAHIFEQEENALRLPVEDEDDIDQIERELTERKYKQYSNGAQGASVVDAYPASFVGGLLAFYSKGHKVLTATDIICGTGDEIASKLPDKLEIGDFVIIREASRDIIRELADRILEKKGMGHLRSLATKWKEALEVESLFSSVEEIYNKLVDNGCTKDIVTIRNWMANEDLIIPQKIEDLYIIAKATEDGVLTEQADAIFEAGKEVRNAHVDAGRILSRRLKNKIAEKIASMGTIDTFNVWDPISIVLEDIGLVKILKVIDVGNVVPVDSTNTNRLLSE